LLLYRTIAIENLELLSDFIMIAHRNIVSLSS